MTLKLVAALSLMLGANLAYAGNVHQAAERLARSAGSEHTQNLTGTVHVDHWNEQAKVTVELTNHTGRADEAFHRAADQTINELRNSGLSVSVARESYSKPLPYDRKTQTPWVKYVMDVK